MSTTTPPAPPENPYGVMPPVGPQPHRHRRRNIIVAAVAVLLAGGIGTAAGLGAGGGGTPAPQPAASTVPAVDCGPGLVPSSGGCAPAYTPPATPPPAPADSMNMPLGTSALITQGGTDAVNLTVTRVKSFTTSADQYGEPPQNGYYLVVHVKVKALPSFTEGFDVSSGDFYARVSGQHFDEGDGNAYSALTMNQSDLGYTTLAAGERTSGLLVFDVPSPHGEIVYAPNLDGQPLGSWKF